ncbi:MAG: hypothetical protein IPP57_04190 [Candidatus Obscuribacter sp.]|nr:hypothetical protein [Candidatus Obscuribacter sp.]
MMNKIGLNGRAIIPLILGLGCVTMATITTRLLTSKREKIIATALLGVAIPCSAQLGVVSGTLARAGGAAAWAVYLTMVVGILAVTGLLLNMVLPGKSTGLMIDLPPMRLPRLDNVLSKTWKKSWNFLVDATPMFFLAGLSSAWPRCLASSICLSKSCNLLWCTGSISGPIRAYQRLLSSV